MTRGVAARAGSLVTPVTARSIGMYILLRLGPRHGRLAILRDVCMDEPVDSMVFEGSEQVIELLRTLYLRNGRSEHLPIVSLVRPDLDDQPLALKYLSNLLTIPARIPHVLVDLEHPPLTSSPTPELQPITKDDVVRVRDDILLTMASLLESGRGGRFRLDRFRDVVWLMSQNLTDAQGEPMTQAAMHLRYRELRKRLRRRASGHLDTAGSTVVADDRFPRRLAWLVDLIRLLIILIPPLWFRARFSGRLPVISGRYRWFLHQPYLAPGRDDNFIALAERLVADKWSSELPEQVLRFMVNAFLEDLRIAFHGRGWWKKYRTTYPIVLLNGVTRANGGYILLRTVNDVRNEIGKPDPLLLVSCSRKVPPYASDPNGQVEDSAVFSASDADAARRKWSNTLSARTRRRGVAAWYIRIKIPHCAVGDTARVYKQRLDAVVPFQNRHPPWWRTRMTAVTTIVLVFGVTIGAYSWQGFRASCDRCADGFTWLGFAPDDSDVVRVNDECIGVTDGSNAHLLPHGDLFDQVRTTVLAQNRLTEQQHTQQPLRPLVTLVFLDALTPGPGPVEPDPMPAEREQLAGVAVAQRQQLDKSQESDPLVRILIANAGWRYQHGDQVGRQLGKMSTMDHSIVAVVGMNETRASTLTTIKTLAAAGLPVIAATLGADILADQNQMFFQVAPQNRRQAEVIAAYAASLRESGPSSIGWNPQASARIYLPDDATDTYSENLAADLNGSFRKRGFSVESVTFTPSGNTPGTEIGDRRVADTKEAGRDACGFSGIILYAGRALPDFQGFLDGVSDRCKDSPPFIIANHDVEKYVANEEVRRANTVPFRYISYAVHPSLSNIEPRTVDFYPLLNNMFPYETTNIGRSLDDYSALTYDAAYTAITATSFLSTGAEKIPPTGGTLWRELPSITDAGDAKGAYAGVTGTIDFGGVLTRRVPLNKPVAILQVKNGNPDATEHIYCAKPGTRTQPHWCPLDQ